MPIQLLLFTIISYNKIRKMAVSKSSSVALYALFMFLLIVSSQGQEFDVTKYGAKPNSDITKAVNDAWKEACASTTPAKVVIPAGTFSLGQIEFAGPCKAPIEVRIDATLLAPIDPAEIPKGKQWITASHLSHFTLSGTGILDGRGGEKAWGMNDPKKNVHKPCGLQYNLSFNFLNHSTITGITTKDSKNFHCNVMTCFNVTFDNFHISAPEESPNTDGIHLGWSKEITIKNSKIATGDDCVSIGDGCEQLHIEGVTCGPGHGISVGSLGKNPNEKPVIGVYVSNCTFIKTQNGVRIKTWPDSHPGVVTDMHFEDLTMDQVQNPVVIEQDYCPHDQCVKQKPSLVKISKVTIKNVRGTSAGERPVKLRCSEATGCEGVEISNINLSYDGKYGPAKMECLNVKPTLSSIVGLPGCL